MTKRDECARYLRVELRHGARPSRDLLSGWLVQGGKARTFFNAMNALELRERDGLVRLPQSTVPTTSTCCACPVPLLDIEPDVTTCLRCGRRYAA